MNAETIPRQFLESVRSYDKKDAFRYKSGGRYVDVSHREMLDKVHNAAVGLHALKLAKVDRVGLISENRIEWAIADLATLSAGCISVPVYPTLPSNQVEYVLRDAETRVVFVSDDDQLAKVLACRENVPSLHLIVTFGDAGEHDGVMS